MARPIRVGLDVSPIVVCQTGLVRYTELVWAALAERDDVELRAFAAGRGRARPSRFPYRRLAIPLRVLEASWRKVHWPRGETLAGAVDLVHSLGLTPPPTRVPLVVTIHDVMAVTHPHLWPPGEDCARRALLRAMRPDVVVATCEATADEIAEVAGVARDRVVVAPLGAMPVTAEAGDPLVDGPYLLAVGAMTPRKGFDTLARAVAKLGPDAPPLVIAGPDWWRSGEVRAAIREADVHGKVRLLGEVGDATLAALYRHATMCCHPSVAEGFGLTCLEAMSFGRAVVATDIPSIREVGEGAVRLVPVGDEAAMAEAIGELLANEAVRADLGRRAQLRAAAFTWERTAEGVVRAYRLALAG